MTFLSFTVKDPYVGQFLISGSLQADILKVDFFALSKLNLTKKLCKKRHKKYSKSHIKGEKTCKNDENA